jgi:hypothetical protein
MAASTGVYITAFFIAFLWHHTGLLFVTFTRPPGERWQHYEGGFIPVLGRSFGSLVCKDCEKEGEGNDELEMATNYVWS